MPELKKISREAIPRALQKAERYRLLNQSWATESICLDILEVDPTNQQVIVMLMLALTDQFGDEPRRAGATRPNPARADHRSLPARVLLTASSTSGSDMPQLATQAVHADAMAHEAHHQRHVALRGSGGMRPPGNDDAILRWNTCARTLENVARHGT